MKNSSKQIDRKILKTLEPLNRLNPILLEELAAKSIIDEVPAGKIICRHGEKDSRQIYLISGQIEVVTPGETKTNIIKSKSALTTPLTQGSPHHVTIKTKAASTLLYIDADLLELLMSDEPQLNATYEVTEIEADAGDDWMLTFLQSPVFLQLPTENIQKLLTHMEEIPVKKDQVVIKQGDSDENYYIIKSGSCNVHRQPHKESANVLLATLPVGSGFGEEALVSNSPRNATITMRENGSLMRLKKEDFLTFLINPLINYFEYNETQNKLKNGGVGIDIRTEEQNKQKPIGGAVNIPLNILREKLDSLNAEREYLLICNDGSQSAAAAFLFIQHGLKCSVLKGGLNSFKGNTQAQATEKPAAVTESKQVIGAKKQAEQDAALIKQRALKEAEQLRAAKAETERKAFERRQNETNKAMRHAEEMMKKSTAAAEQARKQAEQEATRIKQQAKEEAEYLRAKAEAARQKMEQDDARLKEEEKRKHDAILAEAKKQADKIAATKTQQAAAEADAIRQKAKEDAARLHNELEQTRKQIQAEATRVIIDLKEQSKKASAEQEVHEIKEEVLVEIVAESKPYEEIIDYKSVSIPGMSPVEPLSDIDAKRKVEAIKVKLAQSQPKPVSQQHANTVQTATDVKVHKTNDKTILENDDDLFIFNEPEIAAKQTASTPGKPVVSHRTQAESALTQISIEPTQQQKSVVIYPKQEQETVHKNNPFLNQGNSPASTSSHVSAASPQQFNKQAYIRKQNTKSNSFAIAASFLMILAGAIFTLHATNTLKVQSIAALFNSGNDSAQPATAIAKTKTIRKKVLRADTKVNIKTKVGNKMDNIMQNWQEVLSEAENPKKSQ